VSTCLRFEEEALLRLEQGLPLESHFSTCPDCQAARATYERLQHDIASLERVEPPAGWEKGVWDNIAAPKPFIRQTHWIWPFGWAVAAALVAVILLPPLFQRGGAPTLRANIQAGTGPIRRGETAAQSPVALGSVLNLSATAPGARYVELRVYRNADQLILQTSRVGKAAHDEILRATLLLDAVGEYQPALFVSSHAIPSPSDSRDSDYATARSAGAEVILGSPISVH
jgi:hypothetical protein